MLQTSLSTADGVRRFNVYHTAILWLRPRLQDIGPPETIHVVGYRQEPASSKDWHIRFRHLWDQWSPSARPVAETPGGHNARTSTQTLRKHLNRFALRARRPYRCTILNRQRCAAGLHLVSVKRLAFLNLPHTGLLKIKCSPYTALPAYSPSGWDDIPQTRIINLSPFMPQRFQIVHEAHGLSLPLFTLPHLTVCCTEQNATKFFLANDDSRQIAYLAHTKQFLWAVSNYY